eukprot:Pgem_evm1s7542
MIYNLPLMRDWRLFRKFIEAQNIFTNNTYMSNKALIEKGVGTRVNHNSETQEILLLGVFVFS